MKELGHLAAILEVTICNRSVSTHLLLSDKMNRTGTSRAVAKTVIGRGVYIHILMFYPTDLFLFKLIDLNLI